MLCHCSDVRCRIYIKGYLLTYLNSTAVVQMDLSDQSIDNAPISTDTVLNDGLLCFFKSLKHSSHTTVNLSNSK